MVNLRNGPNTVYVDQPFNHAYIFFYFLESILSMQRGMNSPLENCSPPLIGQAPPPPPALKMKFF